MTRSLTSSTRIPLAGALLLLGCTEPRRVDRNLAPQPVLDATLELSDSLPTAGSDLIVFVRLRGTKATGIASFTARVSYDTASLTYLSDVAFDDGATRISNPTPGLIRSAGIRIQGFGAAPLVGHRFRVRGPLTGAFLRLSMDELHDANRANAAASLRVVPLPVIIRP
jgi:hypothetical protein